MERSTQLYATPSTGVNENRPARDGQVPELTRFAGARTIRARMGERTVTCPTCGAPAPWLGNAHRPFCSLTCRLIDLGGWLDAAYRVPADEDGDVP